jgi:hypothetical protein
MSRGMTSDGRKMSHVLAVWTSKREHLKLKRLAIEAKAKFGQGEPCHVRGLEHHGPGKQCLVP